MKYGVALQEPTAAAALKALLLADEAGVATVWMTSGPCDPLVVFSAAAHLTKRVKFGTSVLQTLPRHPIATVQAASTLAEVSGDRFRLGVGPSSKLMMHDWLGYPYDSPLAHLREYLIVARQALNQGRAEFNGEFFQVNVQGGPFMQLKAEVPLLISALGLKSFEMAGELSDGAISWNCPAKYLREQALPQLKKGAERAGRPHQPLIAHTFFCVTDHPQRARELGRERLALYHSSPFYLKIFKAAGDEPEPGRVSDFLLDQLMICGKAEECAAKLQAFGEAAGADEVLARLLQSPDGPDRQSELHASLRLVASL